MINPECESNVCAYMQADKRHTTITDEAQLLDAQLHDMVNNQRLYNKTVLDMQAVGDCCDYMHARVYLQEIKRNEQLLSRMHK